MEWRLPEDSDGYLQIRLFGPTDTSTTRVEIHTGPATFGVVLDTSGDVRRFGWAVLASCMALADLMDAAPTDAPASPQTTIYDHLTGTTST